VCGLCVRPGEPLAQMGFAIRAQTEE
jgi:hypothetical protein